MKVHKAWHAPEVVVKAFEITKIVELPGGFARLDPLAGLCPAPNRGPSRRLDPQQIFQYPASPPQPEILDPPQL